MEMKLDENWLNAAVGWRVAKEARQMRKAGAVLRAGWEENRLQGLVLRAGKPSAAGFVFGKNRLDLTNLCQCPDARRRGEMCVHSAAVALAVIHRDPPREGPAAGAATPSAAFAKEPAREERAEMRQPVRAVFHERWIELWDKDRVPVRIEAAEQGDRTLWRWLDQAGVTKLPAQLVLKAEQAGSLLSALPGIPGVGWGQRSLTIAEVPAARLRVDLRNAGGEFRLSPLPWRGEDQILVGAGGRHWAIFPQRGLVQAMRRPPGGMEAIYERLLREEEVRLGPASLLAALDGWHECLEFLTEPGEGLALQQAEPAFALRLEGSLNALAGKVTVRYPQGVSFVLGQEPAAGAFPLRPDPEAGLFLLRNGAAEARARRLLTEEFGFTGPDAAGQFQMRGEKEIGRFLAHALVELRRVWEVSLGERFQFVTRNVTIIRPELVPGGTDANWFSFAIRYGGAGGVEISRQEIQKLLQKGQNKVQLANGKSAFVDLDACAEVDEVLFDARPEQAGGAFRARAAQGGFLQAALGGADLAAADPVGLAALGALERTLRDYQREGVAWIVQRWRGAASAGLLADEMGLGKTLQSLAAAELLLQDAGEGQVLVVCPTSLLANWKREAERFLPHRRVCILHGTQRWEASGVREQAHLLITSYALLARDSERWQEQELLAAILDEAGAIKNPATKNAQAARELKARYRLALTGTPVENSVRELWSIFEFLVPGYLGGRQEFRERYENAMVAGTPPRAVLERLRQRVRPLLLRRTKALVARELPEKIEQIRYCELGADQAQLYEQILRESRRKIDDALAGGSEGQARMTILTALLRLRQLCCDPRLLRLDGAEALSSGKLEQFEELLEECVSGDHRMLVFSQFASMLRLLRTRLEELGMPYCYLDGASTDRAEQVERFQSGGEARLFLISLKAGGYGLNLTRADTVIHYDPWWNPAVEAQATDRAHRIGQTRVVTSYKLIAAGTVEEKILALQRRKRSVIEAALDDGEPLMQGLSTEELVEVVRS